MFNQNNALQLEVKEKRDRFTESGTIVEIRAKQVPQPVAIMAFEFLTHWGMIAGVPDGEDSSGQSKVRLATPEELVTRAVQTAELMFATVAEKGWVLDVPEPKESEPKKPGLADRKI